MMVSSDIQLWGRSCSTRSMATSALTVNMTGCMKDLLSWTLEIMLFGCIARSGSCLCLIQAVLVNINSFTSHSFVEKRVFWLTGRRTVFTQPSVFLRSVLPIMCMCVPRLISQTAGWLYLMSSMKNDTSAATVSAPPAPAPHPCGKHPQRDSEHMLSIMRKTPGFISISLLMG